MRLVHTTAGPLHPSFHKADCRRAYLLRRPQSGPSVDEGPRPILTFAESLDTWIEGIKGLTRAVLILIMAWAVGQALKVLCAVVPCGDVCGVWQ